MVPDVIVVLSKFDYQLKWLICGELNTQGVAQQQFWLELMMQIKDRNSSSTLKGNDETHPLSYNVALNTHSLFTI